MRQRGFTIIQLALVLGIVLAVGAAILTVKQAIENYGDDQHDRGVAESDARWLKRENAEVVATNAKILELENDAREMEHMHAEELAAADANLQRRLANVEDRRRADVLAVADRTLRLRDPGGAAAACPNPGGGQTAEVAPAASGGDGRAAGELSREASSFLLDLVSDADRNTEQLAACQAVVRADRRTLDPPE